MARKKRKVENISVIDIADKGKCIGKTTDGEVVLLDGALPGQMVDAILLRKKKSVWNGVVEHVSEESPFRVSPRCQHFGICGGCKWQHLDYNKQIEFKQKQVENALVRIAKLDIQNKINPIIACESIYDYRNKLEFTFSEQRWLTNEEISDKENIAERRGLGFHRPGAFDKVVDIETCHLQGELSNQIRNRTRELAFEMDIPFFNIRHQDGILRNLMIRRSLFGEVMVLFSFYKWKDELADFLQKIELSFPQINALLYCINPKGNDTIYDLDIKTFAGKDHIIERLRDISFKIGPKSFFQTNTQQTEILYSKAIELADIKKSDTVYDLYSGIGSIGISLAHNCKQVVGIETVPEAVLDAMENVRLNQIDNAQFVVGDVKDILNPSFVEKYGNPDVIITDPPRAGMSPQVIDYLLKIRCPKLVYISCNPSTQARDLEALSQSYNLIVSQAVDMFPHTSHIENIVLLTLKNI